MFKCIMHQTVLSQILYDKKINNLLFSIFDMDGLILEVFSNSRKSKLSQKDYEQVANRQSKKNLGPSNNFDSSVSISKNLDEPKSSDAFSNVMKGIMDLSKRIQDKYSPTRTNKLQNSSSDSTNKWKMDKINQQKHQDDDGNNVYQNKQNKQGKQNKEEKSAIRSSKKFLQTASYQPYIQRRSKSPSRPRGQGPPENSRIVYQEPTPQIRIIPPTPPPPQPQPIFIPAEQPVIRRNIQQPPRFLPYPPQPQPQHHTFVSHPNPPQPPPPHLLPVIHPVQYPIRPPIYFNRPPPIIEYRPIIPQVIRQPVIIEPPLKIKRPKIRPPYYQYYPETSQNTQNNPNNGQTINNLPINESVIDIRQTTVPQIPATEEDKKLMEQLKKQPNKVNMTVEELQKILEKQSNMNNNDSAQILKQLKQLTQEQKKNKITPQMLQKLKKTQKTIVKTKKITKKTTNKNSSNSKSQQSQQAALMSMMGMTNFQDMLTPQNYQNYLPMMQYFMNGNNPQMLADGSSMNGMPGYPGYPGFPGMPMGGPSIQNGSEKKLRAPLGQIPQNIQQELGQSTGRKGQKTKKIPKQKRSKQQVDSQLLVKQKYLNQIIDNEIKRLETIDENYETNICLNDLEQLKKTNQTQGKWFLSKFDEIIHKMEKQKIVQKPDLQKKYYNTEQQPEVFIYRAGQRDLSESVTQNFFSKSKDIFGGFFDRFKS